MFRNLDEEIKALIIRMDRVPHIDQSGLHAMEDAILDLRRKDVLVILTGLHPQPYNMLRTIDIVPDLLPEEQIFDDFQESIDWLREELANGKDATLISLREKELVPA